MLAFRAARLDDSYGIATVRVRAWQCGFKEILPASFLDAMSIQDAAEKTKGWMSLPDPPGHDWVVEDDGKLVGWAHTFMPARAIDDSNCAEISAIYALPSHWGRGVGYLMVEQLRSALRAGGARTVMLWVMESNERARRFYERQGFVLGHGRRALMLVPESDVWEVSYELSLHAS